MNNRQIKFRVFFENEWRYFVIGQSMTEYQRAIYDQCCLLGLEFLQFTGQLDKNGKEIYEGDIVHVCYGDDIGFMGEDSDYKDEVYFDLESAMFAVKREIGLDTLESNFGKSITVVGNIYQNPELK